VFTTSLKARRVAPTQQDGEIAFLKGGRGVLMYRAPNHRLERTARNAFV
jgi:hypothetical protein